MANAFFKAPEAVNETVRSYAKGSPERLALLEEYQRLFNQQPVEIPMYIGKKQVHTAEKRLISPPHDHKKCIGSFSYGNASHVEQAIAAALEVKKAWSSLPWTERAAIFLKAADLLSGPYRNRMNAATMLGQSKNIFQAEIDAACEMIDFFRFNVQFMTQIYQDQPVSAPGIWNRIEYRPLEGFVFAVTPFNFTAIAANLCAAPAMMGNVVVWKPADSQVYSAQVIMELFQEAGLPPGVINMVTVDGPTAGEVVFNHPEFAGLHFTGSTSVFKHLWKTIGNNIDTFKSYPRIVGETGGKDFVFVHESADPAMVATALSRGAFEYQGQKCSAASRAYIPTNRWLEIREILLRQVNSFKMGSTGVPSNFVNAVIDEKAFDKISGFIDYIKAQPDAEIIAGGNYNKSIGYFIEPTIVLTTNPSFRTLCEEIFGPVLTIFLYEPQDLDQTLALIDQTSDYALTGAILAKDRFTIQKAMTQLEHSAGNLYINDKPTGAVVGQQPFGGARGSGTNDKAGASMNLLRWVSARTIKETFVSPTEYQYPFMEE
ncbi:MAG: L-glutamate gamma-semialdehyde dehydrogenase [Flavobacteriales bacterium]